MPGITTFNSLPSDPNAAPVSASPAFLRSSPNPLVKLIIPALTAVPRPMIPVANAPPALPNVPKTPAAAVTPLVKLPKNEPLPSTAACISLPKSLNASN